METAKDILDRHAKLKGYASYDDMILLGNPFYIQEVVDAALPEIADKAWERLAIRTEVNNSLLCSVRRMPLISCPTSPHL